MCKHDETERILKDEADKVKIEGFDARFDKIKDNLDDDDNANDESREFVSSHTGMRVAAFSSKENVVKIKLKTIFIPLVAVSAFLITFAVIFPIVFFNSQQPILYYEDELFEYVASEDEFYFGLSDANIIPVDFSELFPENFRLVVTEDLLVKGGALELYDGEDDAAMAVEITFYDKTVAVSESKYEDHDLFYAVGSASIKYKLTEDLKEGDFEPFEYIAVAWHNILTYKIKYFSIYDNITDFFDSLFK